MTFRLSKAQIAEKAKLHENLNRCSDNVSGAIEAYNQALAEAREFCACIAQIAQDKWNDESEKWQESDRAVDAQGWIEEWESADLDDLDEPDFHMNVLDKLPEAVT